MVKEPLYGGVELNTCDGYVTPPILSIAGDDIVASQPLGETLMLRTDYTLSNIGEKPLPWSVGLQDADKDVWISTRSGELQAGDEVSVAVYIDDSASLPLGTYRNLIQFQNNYSGALNQSHLGSQEREVVINVLAPSFPEPSITSATRVAGDAVKVTWGFDDPSHLARGFRLWHTQGDPEGTGWQGHPDTIGASMREGTFTGLPSGDLYVAVEAFGEDVTVHQTFSASRLVPGSPTALIEDVVFADPNLEQCVLDYSATKGLADRRRR